MPVGGQDARLRAQRWRAQHWNPAVENMADLVDAAVSETVSASTLADLVDDDLTIDAEPRPA